MKSWRFIRGITILAGVTAVIGGALTEPAMASSGSKKKSQESSLAGLRPGKDKLKTAINLHGPYYRKVSPDSEQSVVWVDTMKHRALRVELDEKGVIQKVTVSAIDPLISAEDKQDAPLPSRMIATGKGLRIGYNVHDDVKDTYGDPDESTDGLRHGHNVRVLSYNFEKNPQSLEILCERPGGRLLEITLASGGN
jgi:hypothetical protein